MTPGDPKLKGSKIDISKQAERVAAQYSLSVPQGLQAFLDQQTFRMDSEDPFMALSEDAPIMDPFEPMMIQEKGFQPRFLREVFLIRKGSFNGIEFTDEDLQALVDNWDRPIPFQIDHSTSWDKNVGNLLSIRKQGSRVYGLAEFIGWGPIDAVQSGQAKTVSIGFALKPRKLIEVSLTQFPAVGGNDPAQILPLKKKKKMGLSEDSQRNESVTFKTHDGSQVETVNLNSQPNGGQAPTKGKRMTEEEKTNFSESAVLAQMNKQIADLEAKFAAAQAQNEKLQSEVQSANHILKLQRNTQIVVEFAQKGLMLTANKEAELEFINGLSDQQLEKYQALKEANGPVIQLGRLSVPEVTAPGELSVSAQDMESKKARMRAAFSSARALEKN